MSMPKDGSRGHSTIADDAHNNNNNPSEGETVDPRLTKALTYVRKLSNPHLKERTISSEWQVLKSDVEKDILLEAVHEPTFWREVKQHTISDMEILKSEKASKIDSTERLIQMFKSFDKDETDTIDASQLQQMLLYMGISVTEKDIKGILGQYDSDGDGRITQREFLQVMEAAQAGELAIGVPTSQGIRRASFRLRKEASGSTKSEQSFE
eukprot:Tbor_TRINITY_DN5362_c7_g1::TRINITY_DN5362_c7_g1_i1::g.5048::m.5048